MRALKVLVVLMGVLLVGGTGLLIAAIIDRANRPRPEPVAAVSARGFDRSLIELPAGARVIATEAVGDRLAVRIALAEGGEALILIDPRNGARLGTIELRPAAGAR